MSVQEMYCKKWHKKVAHTNSDHVPDIRPGEEKEQTACRLEMKRIAVNFGLNRNPKVHYLWSTYLFAVFLTG